MKEELAQGRADVLDRMLTGLGNRIVDFQIGTLDSPAQKESTALKGPRALAVTGLTLLAGFSAACSPSATETQNPTLEPANQAPTIMQIRGSSKEILTPILEVFGVFGALAVLGILAAGGAELPFMLQDYRRRREEKLRQKKPNLPQTPPPEVPVDNSILDKQA